MKYINDLSHHTGNTALNMPQLFRVAVAVPLNPPRAPMQRPSRLLITPFSSGHGLAGSVAVGQQLRQLPVAISAVPVDLELQELRQ